MHGQQVALHQVKRGQGACSNDDEYLVEVRGNDMPALPIIRPDEFVFSG
jgi:hypothetical protein